MRFGSYISDEETSDDALAAVIDSAQEATEDGIDALFVFFTPHHHEQIDRIVEQLWLELDPQCIVGCSGVGVIGQGREIEQSPGLALLTASLPDVRLHPFHIDGPTAWREILDNPDEMRDRVGIGPETAAVVAFADPFTTPLDPASRRSTISLASALDAAAPGVPLIGGMASGGRQPGANRLIRNDEIFDSGVVGLSLSGPLAVQTIVSQGCRPIGKPMIITKAHENVIEQLGGRPALTALREVVGGLSEADKALLQNGLMIGRAVSEYREGFSRGDFLVRNVLNVDEDTDTVAIADYVRVGQTVQFHVRDAATADEDLRLMLAGQAQLPAAAGGLLTSCNGRGLQMFDQPNHDISVARRFLPDAPLAGFFAMGEFGPVGGKNFVHGHTASIALFRPAIAASVE